MLGFLTVILALFIAACEGQKGEASYGEPVAQTLEEKSIIPQKKYALLIVESKSCIYCKQLNKDIETEKNLQEALRDIDLFRILYESRAPVKANFGGSVFELSENELAKKLNALSFPYLIFYDRDGNIILQIPGYVYPQQLICIIDYVKTEAYKQEDVNSYVKRKGCA